MSEGETAAGWHKSGGTVVCFSPCVCVTQAGRQPVPYMVASSLQDSARTSPDVMFGAEEAFTMDSRLTTLVGNEPGTGGGLSSGVSQGWCRPVISKSNVLVNGYQVIQNDCVFEMNCAGPEGTSDTLGRLSLTIAPGDQSAL